MTDSPKPPDAEAIRKQDEEDMRLGLAFALANFVPVLGWILIGCAVIAYFRSLDREYDALDRLDSEVIFLGLGAFLLIYREIRLISRK